MAGDRIEAARWEPDAPHTYESFRRLLKLPPSAEPGLIDVLAAIADDGDGASGPADPLSKPAEQREIRTVADEEPLADGVVRDLLDGFESLQSDNFVRDSVDDPRDLAASPACCAPATSAGARAEDAVIAFTGGGDDMPDLLPW
ncbi:hypothetical protein KFE25_008127 [Diacronema lutheri]|uniref:Uncharacterized protein n=1 Tax=Diacronema lutheri TaxID=2081491 RepID=A0A8J6CGI6_DIALT|nr:hypothetical protein KFE25_008127 [Diacronema lutheri]